MKQIFRDMRLAAVVIGETWPTVAGAVSVGNYADAMELLKELSLVVWYQSTLTICCYWAEVVYRFRLALIWVRFSAAVCWALLVYAVKMLWRRFR